MSYLPFVFVLVAVIALLAFSARARRRQAAAEAQRTADIVVGTEVMTTSGLYGTVVAVSSEESSDQSVLLAIAPGVEVRWAFAALRTIDSLPEQYRGADPAGLGEGNGLGNGQSNGLGNGLRNGLGNGQGNGLRNGLEKA